MVIPAAQQFAEKVHAYTFPWTDRINTRTKDLVDLVLLIERGKLEASAVRDAAVQTFLKRGTHPIPEALPVPPQQWASDFIAMAQEAEISTADLEQGFRVLDRYWTTNKLGNK